MKIKYKKIQDLQMIEYLRTVTDRYGDVIVDDMSISYHTPESFERYLYQRMNSFDARMFTKKVNCDKYYYWCRHRIGKPAVFDEWNGSISWHVNGKLITRTRDYCDACGFSPEKTLIWVLKYGDILPRFSNQL